MESIGIQKTNSEKSLCQSNILKNEFKYSGDNLLNEYCYFSFLSSIGFNTIEDIVSENYLGLSFINKDCYIETILKIMQ